MAMRPWLPFSVWVTGRTRSSPTAGAFAVAWVLAKFTEIPRLAVTLALTPRVAAMRSVVRLAVRGVVS